MTTPRPPDPANLNWLTAYAEATIAAPRQVVWDVLTDFPAYDQWNPFTYNVVVETLAVGQLIRFTVRMSDHFRRVQIERFAQIEPPHLLAWGLRSPSPLLNPVRYQLLSETADGYTHYQTWEHFTGLAAPVLGVTVLGQVRRGFADVAAALKQRAESER